MDTHEYFMLTSFLISNLECNQPTLHCSPCHSHPNLTLIPFLKALIPFLSIMKLFFKESSTVIVPVSTALKLHKLYIVKNYQSVGSYTNRGGSPNWGFCNTPTIHSTMQKMCTPTGYLHIAPWYCVQLP